MLDNFSVFLGEMPQLLGNLTLIIPIIAGNVFVLKLIWSFFFKSKEKSPKVWVDAYLSIDAMKTVVETECVQMNEALNACAVTDDDTLCAQQMRDIIMQNYMNYRQLESDPGLIMKCSRHTSTFNGAIYTRFVVQYNLFAGSVVSLGSAEQREILYDLQAKGSLGCFAFTESSTGVLTGIKVETTATFHSEKECFVLDSNGSQNAKAWISQGLHAEYAVILANVIIGGISKGPHLFFSPLQSRGTGKNFTLKPLPGVMISRMSPQNCLPGLDYATIEFKDFIISKSGLLSRYSGLDANNNYVISLPKGCRRMVDLLLNRLVAGRVCLSEYSVKYTRNLMATSWAYAGQRKLPGLGKKAASTTTTIADLPLVSAAFVKYGKILEVVAYYLARTREELTIALDVEESVPNDIIESACISKFVGTSISVDIISILRKIIGSYSLMASSHLGASSFICNGICFAEGDNTVMELKVVGELVKRAVPLLQWGLLFRSLIDSNRRKIVFAYLSRVIYAVSLGSAALERGQLLKDIAWARAHLLICDAWTSSGRPYDSLLAYVDGVAHFPTPIQI